ncbi:MAG TPA: hypothetical protein VKR38_17125 [Usitatibacter sp.]|nr:hypothetical protein [Usitatibacter sp.]
MLKILVPLLLASTAALPCAAADPSGRWSGTAKVPGRDMPIVLDLAKDGSGAWAGSLIVPGFDIKGAPLGNLKVAGDNISFDIGDALGAEPYGPARFEAHADAGGTMSGELSQGGNKAPFTLKRSGAAQVELAVRSTAVSRETEGRWIGEYEMGGYPRHVTVDIANRPGAAATVEFVVVGKATTKLPVDFVSEQEGLLRIQCSAYRINFEGRLDGDKNRIVGTFENGPFELPLTLRREGKAS